MESNRFEEVGRPSLSSGWCPSVQAEMSEYFCNHLRVFNRGDDLHNATPLRAMFSWVRIRSSWMWQRHYSEELSG